MPQARITENVDMKLGDVCDYVAWWFDAFRQDLGVPQLLGYGSIPTHTYSIRFQFTHGRLAELSAMIPDNAEVSSVFLKPIYATRPKRQAYGLAINVERNSYMFPNKSFVFKSGFKEDI